MNGQTFCGRVLEEDLDHIDVLRAREGVPTNTDTERLAEANVGRLCDGLVCECSGARDNTCTPQIKPQQMQSAQQ